MADPARYDGSRPEPAYDTLLPPMTESELDSQVEAAVAAERERCAKIAESAINNMNGQRKAGMARAIARRIRDLKD